MKRLVLSGLMLLAVSTALPVWAGGLLEVRGGVGLLSANPNAFENEFNQTFNENLGSSSFDNYNVDVFLNIPLCPLNVGLRREWMNTKSSGNATDSEIDVNQLMVLVDWRLLDNVVYVGPIVGVGFPKGDLKINGSKTSLDRNHLTYSLAGEAGLKLGGFILGAEAGYSSMSFDTQSDDLNKTTVNLSGFYGKAMVGMSFF